jgi:hypothetical protein
MEKDYQFFDYFMDVLVMREKSHLPIPPKSLIGAALPGSLSPRLRHGHSVRRLILSKCFQRCLAFVPLRTAHAQAPTHFSPDPIQQNCISPVFQFQFQDTSIPRQPLSRTHLKSEPHHHSPPHLQNGRRRLILRLPEQSQCSPLKKDRLP